VDGGQRCPGRRVAGDAGWRKDRLAAHSERGAMLRRDLRPHLTLSRGSLDRRILIAWDKMNLGRNAQRVGYQDLSVGMKGISAPVHASNVAGVDQRARNTGRGENALIL